MVGEDGQENIANRDMLTIFDRILSEVREEMKEKGREDEFIGARVSNSLYVWNKLCANFPRLYTPPFATILPRNWNGIPKIALL